MTIRQKILYAFLIVTSIAILFTAVTAFGSARDNLAIIINNDLEKVTAHKKMMVEKFFENLREDVTFVKEMRNVVEALPRVRINEKGVVTDGSLLVDKALLDFLSAKGIEDIMFVNARGQIVHSFNSSHEKKERGHMLDEYLPGSFELGMSDIYMTEILKNKVQSNEFAYGILVVGPVRNKKGEFLGEVVLEAKTDELYDIIRDDIGLGKSGETILSKKVNDREIAIISPLRYRENTIHNNIIIIGGSVGTGMQLSVAGNSGIKMIYDYRGVRSLASWNYIPSLKWGIVSKIDEAEVFNGIKGIKKNVLLVLLVTLLCVFVVSKSIARLIVAPILHLRKETRIISGGDISHHVESESSGETGELADAFNKMTERLRRVYSSLDNKVKRRTETIENEKSKFISLTENLPVGVMMVEIKSRKIVAINTVMMSLLLEKESLIGKRVDILSKIHFKNEDGLTIPARKIPIIASLSNSKKMSENILIIDRTDRGDGILTVHSTISPIKDEKGNITFMTMVLEDITKERQIDRAKTEFVSLASHQFRTPLTAINWYTEILLKECGNRMTARQKQLINEVANGGKRLGILVNTMLNISRIDMGTFMLDLEKVNIKSVVKKVLGDVGRQIKVHHLHVEEVYQNKLPAIMADESAMEIIIQNLITNAVKYTKNGGSISIQANIAKKNSSVGGQLIEKDSFVIMVKDDGIGIKKSEQKNMFMKFYRASNVRQVSVEGTGLGLYLIKSITENVGGIIWFNSEVNKGSTFYVALPVTGMKPHKVKKGGKKFESLSAASVEAELSHENER